MGARPRAGLAQKARLDYTDPRLSQAQEQVGAFPSPDGEAHLQNKHAGSPAYSIPVPAPSRHAWTPLQPGTQGLRGPGRAGKTRAHF